MGLLDPPGFRRNRHGKVWLHLGDADRQLMGDLLGQMTDMLSEPEERVPDGPADQVGVRPRALRRRPHSLKPGQGLDPRRQAGGERLVIANLLGKDRIHIHVRAESLQFLDLFGVAEHEPMGMEGRVQPGPVEFGDIHAELQLGAVHRNEACGKQGCHLIIVIGLAGAM